MAKQKSTTMTLHNASTPAEREAANRTHQRELVDSTLESSSYGGHGHAEGKQGKKGHAMAASDAAQQPHGYIPQGVMNLPANRQNTSSDGAGSANANASTSDYATVDNQND